MTDNKGYSYNVSGEAVTHTNPTHTQPMPVVPQPGQQANIVWMTPPPPIPGVPRGLEYLTQIDQLLVHQQVEIFEMVTGIEMQNKYQIKNTLGEQVYFAAEESGCCMRYWCGPAREFIIHITDNFNQEVMRINREFKCCAGCCWCANCRGCQMEVVIEAPVGQVVGYVRQQYSSCAPRFVVQSAQEEPIFYIDGPICLCQCICCPTDLDFPVTSYEGGHHVGKISKQWAGALREIFTDASHFGINFPKDLDVRVKATLMGALFLIDFMYFEQQQNNNH